MQAFILNPVFSASRSASSSFNNSPQHPLPRSKSSFSPHISFRITELFPFSQTAHSKSYCPRSSDWSVSPKASSSSSSSSKQPRTASRSARKKKKIVVIGGGWAGLGATHHLAKQGFDVTLLEASKQLGGLVSGWRTPNGKPVEAGIHGFWYPYWNIFDLVRKELQLNPFTEWTRSAQYSPSGLQAESPIYHQLPRLPTPLGPMMYTTFKQLPLVDRLSALPLFYAVIDFDNSHSAWEKYDTMTARELFRSYGCTERLYKECFESLLLVGLFAPGEQCSAAAALGMLYYFILAHQSDFDVAWCTGTVQEKIFKPWIDRIQANGGQLMLQRRVSDIILDESGNATGVVCNNCEIYDADAIIFSVGISGMQGIVKTSTILKEREEFLNVMNLQNIDVMAIRLYFDRKVKVERPSNAVFGFDNIGWTFFDLNQIHDEFKNSETTAIECDFYYANQLLPLTDDAVVAKAKSYLETINSAFVNANVVDYSVVRIPRGVTHYHPGSYKSMPTAITSIPNVFLSGDWISNLHGSFAQEKAYVTGLEAANHVVDILGNGEKELATIIPVEPDEPHIRIARTINKTLKATLTEFIPNLIF